MIELYLYFPGRMVVCSADNAVVHEMIRAIRACMAGLRTYAVRCHGSIPAEMQHSPHRLTVDVSQLLAWAMVEGARQSADATDVRGVGQR